MFLSAAVTTLAISFPLVVEIDCTGFLPAKLMPETFKLWVLIENTGDRKLDSRTDKPLTVCVPHEPDELQEEIRDWLLRCLCQTTERGKQIYVRSFDGKPIRKLEFFSSGPAIPTRLVIWPTRDPKPKK